MLLSLSKHVVHFPVSTTSRSAQFARKPNGIRPENVSLSKKFIFKTIKKIVFYNHRLAAATKNKKKEQFLGNLEKYLIMDRKRDNLRNDSRIVQAKRFAVNLFFRFSRVL